MEMSTQIPNTDGLSGSGLCLARRTSHMHGGPYMLCLARPHCSFLLSQKDLSDSSAMKVRHTDINLCIARTVGNFIPTDSLHCAQTDVTIGAWMLALNMSHFDDRRLCQPGCSHHSIGVYDFPACAGLCDPMASLPALHDSPLCRNLTGATLPILEPFFHFPGQS
jgi:hypothetical protein